MQNLSAKDFFTPTPFNEETKNQIWMSIIADGHDNICHCNHPFSHLLASIFPPGHQDRNKTIDQILARDYQEKCHSGGGAGGSHGLAGGDIEKGSTKIKQEEEGEDPEEDLDTLLAAAAAAADPTR